MSPATLLEMLDLRGTGAEKAAELELEILQHHPEFERCKGEVLQVLDWTIRDFLSNEEAEKKVGMRPQALVSRRVKLEAISRRLAGMSPA